jgi:hypothetical protein
MMKWLVPMLGALSLWPAVARSQTCPPPESTQSVDNNNGTYSVSQIVEVNPIIWISNAGDDTISKINTAQNKEVARYRVAFWSGGIGGNGTGWGTHDAWTGPAPSRSGVDASGNAYIANRGFARVAEVIKILSTGCIDRNNNGVCDTSQDTNGNGTIQQTEMYGIVDSNGNGVIEDSELRDERVAYIRPIGEYNEVARALTIDKDGNIWVGMYNTARFYKVDPATGNKIGGPWGITGNPYGAVVDSQNRLFTAALGGQSQTRFPVSNPASQSTYYVNAGYSLAIGRPNNVETIIFAHYTGQSFQTLNPGTLASGMPVASGASGYGVNFDRDGNVLVGGGGVTKFGIGGNVIWTRGLAANCPSSDLRGTIPDANNDIWLVNLSHSMVCKYLADGTHSVAIPVGLYPYTYTDASGIGTLVTNPTGRVVWRISAFEGNYDWSGDPVCFPGAGDVTVTVAASNTVAGLEFANPLPMALTLTNGELCGTIPNGTIGQYVRFVFTLKTGASVTTTNPNGTCAVELPVPNTRPVAQCRNVNVTADWCTASIPNVNNGSYDPDGAGDIVSVVQSPAAGTVRGPGVHPVTLTITDVRGFTAQCTGNVTVNPTPRNEVCDGVDNDCDGSIDEGYVPEQTTCGIGACTRNGVTSCVNGQVRDSCQAGTATAEVCNGQDDDCDGQTDGMDLSLTLVACEKQVGVCSGAMKTAAQCVGGAWQACPNSVYASHAFPNFSTTDSCDNRDNDCDGLRDEDHTVENTTCGTGACGRTGQRICSNGTVVNTCSPTAPAANDATCNGVDDDCDGQTDENYVVTQTSCGTGLCARTGQNFCVNGAVVNSCSPGAPAANDASCNNVDDDCNGQTDEDYVATQTSCGVGECARTGTATCSGGNIVNSCVAGSAAAEVCDGKDNDCDGLVDSADANMALVACEKQQGTCAGLMKNASLCVGGAWQACSDPYYMVNRPSYATQDRCDGTDNDCDGTVDEDFVPAATTCGVGGCQRAGETTCVEGAIVDSCVAAAPRSETCDGIDNDCDGATDAADATLNLVACEKQDGVCAGALKPATLCVAGDWLACGDGVYASNQPGYSTVDGCDNLDNDCDGVKDEDFASRATTCGVGECGATGATSCVNGNTVDSCLPGQPAAELCDGKDNDCDGLVDAVDPNLVSVACEKQTGVCSGVIKPANLCVNGAWQSCPDTIYAAARFGQYSLVDGCDGLNNDCDTLTDEDYVATATSCGRGSCERAGQRICSGGAVLDTCVAGNPTGNDSTCNGLDDDCDGQTDEAYVVRGTTCGQGACERTGFAYCVQGQTIDSCVAAATAATDRTCDRNDDDCDGQVDEDFLPGQICIAGLGACQRTGTLSCGVNGTVCTAAAGIATPEVCDGVDNDCDGDVDEGVAGSVCTRKDTAILSGPPVVTASRTATLRYNDPLNPTATAFQCSLDGGSWVRCDGGTMTYNNLGDGPHTFLVRSVGPDGSVDATPAFHAWSVDQGQPDTLIRVAPLSPAQSTTAHFVFGATITEVATYRCALDPATAPPQPSDYVDCSEVHTFNHLDEGPHNLYVYVVSVSGVADPTPAHHAWTIDLSAPETAITSGPAMVTSDNAATLEYHSPNEPGLTTFRCRFNGGAWVQCDGGVFMVDGLNSGAYTFQVAAVDEGNIQDPTPATWSWTVDSKAPDTFITIYPQNPAQQDWADFAFASDESDVTYRCAFEHEEAPEGGTDAWQPCDPTMVWENLTTGSHIIWVAAVDSVGQWDATPATYTWVVDVTAPDTTITNRPPVQTGPDDGATFNYTSATADVYYECRVDQGGWQRCDDAGLTLPANNLTIGDHTFQVRACTEASGLCDPTPAIASWSVTTSNCPLDAVAPAVICPAGGIHECSGDGQANVSLGGLQATDDCGVIETSEAVPTRFNLGTTSVVLSVEDGNRNRASCISEVTVVDTQAPSIFCGDNVVVANDEGVCGAVVELAEPIAEDGCHPRVSVFNNAPSVFPVGETVVTWTALDPSGHMATCEVKVLVEDREAGRLLCAGELSVDAPADQCGWAGPIEAIARDNCAVDMTTLTQDRTYPVGKTDVLFTSVDPHNNTSTCTTALTVRDVTAPAVTCPTQANDKDMGPFVATATDACEATVQLTTLRCETLGEGGVVTGNLGSADCPARLEAGTLVVDGRLGDQALKLSFKAEGTDPSGNVGVADCELVFDPDKDDDEVLNADDNCPEASNPDQRDVDGDGVGDACDVCPSVKDPAQTDTDDNGVGDACQDLDRDGLLDSSDNCPGVSNDDQLDSDGDGTGDLCDPTPWEGLNAAGSGSAGCEGGASSTWPLLGLALIGLALVRRRLA